MESSKERTHARSEEEEDLLIRSNKKVRSGDNLSERQLDNVKMITMGNPHAATSFAEKLMGQKTGEGDENQDD